MLPDFIHIGVAKAASTWLWKVCHEHPDIYVPDAKPVNYFVADYHRGLDWYEEEYFGNFSGERAVGELSNGYMMFEPALERISRDLGAVKILMTVREPIERAYVHWAHFMKRRNFRPDQTMDLNQVFKPGGFLHYMLWLGPGFYGMRLKWIYRYFPQFKVKILWYEDLCSNPEGFLENFFSFLEVDTGFKPSILHKLIGFPSPDDPENEELKRGIPDELRERLKPIFRDDIEQLQRMTGRDLNHWLR